MKIWITRHGQTKLNKEHLMQGRTDEPLNETGFSQAKAARKLIGDVTFDAVYASPLRRAVDTAVIIGNVPEKDVIIDPRLIEVDFGKYELRPYLHLGLPMFLFWAMPGIFPAPKTVEPISSLVSRTHACLDDIVKEGQAHHCENILIACHGGTMRALSGYMLDKKSGYMWRPRAHNCEIRVFDADPGQHRLLQDYKLGA